MPDVTEQIATAPMRNASNSVLVRMAEKFGLDPAAFHAVVVKTIMPQDKPVSNEQVMAFLLVADTYNLDPLRKQIYAFPSKGGGIVPIVGVDGWIAIMNNHPQYDGLDHEFLYDGDGKLQSCRVRIYRKDRGHPIVAEEFLEECYRATEPWKMKHRMLKHKATTQCARLAFGISGIYDEDEGERIRDAEAAVRQPAAPVRGVKAVESFLKGHDVKAEVESFQAEVEEAIAESVDDETQLEDEGSARED